MKKEIKTEIISTIKSKEDLETFFEVLRRSLRERTTLQLLEKARREIQDGEKCTLDADDKSTFLP